MKKDGGFYLPLFLHVITIAHGARIWISDAGCGQGNVRVREVNLFAVCKLGLLQSKYLAQQNAPNKACTRRWGVWRDSKPFSTPQHFPSRTASRRPPQRG